LPRKQMKRILDAAAAQGVQALSFTGGEPMLFPDDLIDLMTYAGKIGIPFVRTGTNGFLLRHSHKPDFEDRIKRLTDRLADTGLRNFWISIDSASAEDWTYYRLSFFPPSYTIRGKAGGLQIRSCQGLAVPPRRDGCAIGALALEPSDFCNDRVKIFKKSAPASTIWRRTCNNTSNLH